MHELQGGKRTSKVFMQDEWQPGLFYHVIGKVIPGETLFRDEDDMRWFMKYVLRFRLFHFFDILVYCLCGNHFHLAIQTRTVTEVQRSLLGKPEKARSPSDRRVLAGEIDFPTYVHNALAGALSGYARRYGNRHKREGQLLIRPTLHGLTDKGAPGAKFSRKLGCYVGLNYVKHHLGEPDAIYFGSSLSSPRYKIVNHARLLELYGGPAAYQKFIKTYLSRFGHAFHLYDEANFYAALQPRYLNKANGQWLEGDWLSKLEILPEA